VYIACPSLRDFANPPVVQYFDLDKVGVDTLPLKEEVRRYSCPIDTDSFSDRNPLLPARMCLATSARCTVINDIRGRLLLAKGYIALVHVVDIFVRYQEYNLVVDLKPVAKCFLGGVSPASQVQLLAYNTTKVWVTQQEAYGPSFSNGMV
jgi:hypothetical protein